MARLAGGVETDQENMSTGLNALNTTAATGKPRASWHCWTSAGSTGWPEEVLMNTFLEVGIQHEEPNRLQGLLTACERSDREPSFHL